MGALGGGNVSLVAGGDIVNMDAEVPTNARMPGVDPATGDPLSPATAPLLELGGGSLLVQAGNNISGGAYYVERGTGVLDAGNDVLTNPARSILTTEQVAALSAGAEPDPTTWLPTTLYVGDANVTVTAGGSVALGPVANPFLLPRGSTIASGRKPTSRTYSADAGVRVNSLTGSVTLDDSAQSGGASLFSWYNLLLAYNPTVGYSDSVGQPWLRLAEKNVADFDGGSPAYPTGVFGLMAPSLQATAFNGGMNIVGDLTLSPSAGGTIDLLAAGSINGLQANGLEVPFFQFGSGSNPREWDSAVINLSDADPSRIPAVASPLSLGATPASTGPVQWWSFSSPTALDSINILLNINSTDVASSAPLQEKEALHAPGVLHAGDPNPVYIDAEGGDISGLTLFSAKTARIEAGQDITDTALYIQNDGASDISVISAGRNLIPYDPTAPLLEASQFPSDSNALVGGVLSGDIQVSGPGTLKVLTGHNLNLGVGTLSTTGPGIGIASVGNSGNPFLPFAGSDLVVLSGLGKAGDLAGSQLGLSGFISQYADPSTAGANAGEYLPELAAMLNVGVSSGESAQAIWTELNSPYAGLSPASQAAGEDLLALDEFFVVLRDAGRAQNDPSSPYFGTYGRGYAALADLFPGSQTGTAAAAANPAWSGSVSLATREIVTTNGGNISILAPGGGVTVGNPSDPQKSDQGVLTEFGGNISIFAEDSVNVGTSRIFTLHGGSEIIWSSIGNIAAGSGSKTVFSAPPTRVLIDPQSAEVQNDLAGLATGSGIGVLATLAGVAPGDVDLIAPVGTVDAGDAGIRSSGNLNIAALHVLNSANIQAGGVSSGVPVVSAPNIGGLTAASSSSAAASSAASAVANQQQSAAQSQEVVVPSIITVEVLGYGGGDDLSDDAHGAGEEVAQSL